MRRSHEPRFPVQLVTLPNDIFMSAYFCVYGHLASLDDAQIGDCLAVLTHYACEQPQTGVLDFVHEGHFIDVDNDLQQLETLLGAQARGIIDVINHQDWEMHRYTLKNNKFYRERIALDNALDTAYASEFRPR